MHELMAEKGCVYIIIICIHIKQKNSVFLS